MVSAPAGYGKTVASPTGPVTIPAPSPGSPWTGWTTTPALELLPSLLSGREIAAELTVSVNIVKTHIRSIYGKLSVSSRRDAVLRARQRGLLP